MYNKENVDCLIRFLSTDNWEEFCYLRCVLQEEKMQLVISRIFENFSDNWIFGCSWTDKVDSIKSYLRVIGFTIPEWLK